MSEQAKQVYQDLLDEIAGYYTLGDWGGFRRVIHVPHRFVTFEASFVIPTEVELRRLFDAFRDHQRALGVTDFARVCEAAMFRGEAGIEGTHVTHLLRNGNYVEEPFPAKTILRKIDGQWKVTSSDNAVDRRSMITIALVRAGARQIETPNLKGEESCRISQ